jgi:hypothetical protein
VAGFLIAIICLCGAFAAVTGLVISVVVLIDLWPEHKEKINRWRGNSDADNRRI